MSDTVDKAFKAAVLRFIYDWYLQNRLRGDYDKARIQTHELFKTVAKD